MADALQMLREDHDKVKEMFGKFTQEKDGGRKKEIGDEIIWELQIHSKLEEQLFYRALTEEEPELMARSEEEHHVAQVLEEELAQMDASDSHYSAKFHVLEENVRRHIEEEESEVFKVAEKLGKERLAKLGERMSERKQELIQQMKEPAGGRRSSRMSRGGQRKREAARSRSRTS